MTPRRTTGGKRRAVMERRADQTTRPPSARPVRDIPGPRRATGILGPLLGALFDWPYRLALAALYRAGLLPWHLTLLSLAGNIVVGVLLVTGRRFVPGLVLLAAGLMDIFDGAIARLRGEASRAGAFLDSVMDRVSDLIVFSCLFWSLASQRHVLAAALALSSLIVSLLVSQVRAEAEAMGLSMTEGLFQRLERYVALAVGLMVPGMLLPVLVLLTVLGALTVVQRCFTAWRRLPPSR